MITQRVSLLATACLLSVTACDIPTELPKWDPTFAVQLEGTQFSVAQLLPPGVTLSNGNTRFAVSLSPSTLSATLADVCAACAAVSGSVVPKPAFSGSFTAGFVLPNDVFAVDSATGVIRLDGSHNFSFDPLRPAANTFGTLTISLVDGRGAVHASTQIRGQDRAFPPATVIRDSLILTSAMLSQSPFTLRAEITSPAGDATFINAGARMVFNATPSGFTIGGATLRVVQRQVTAAPVQINLTGIDNFIVDRVRGGSMRLTFHAGFGQLAGTIRLTFTGGLAPIEKTVTLPRGPNTVDVAFTEAEIRSLLGNVISVAMTGTVSGNGNPFVRPGSTYSVSPLLILQLGAADE